MAVKRTPEIREAMDRALRLTLDYLNNSDMPVLPRYDHPRVLADAVVTCRHLLEGPLRSKTAKRAIMNTLQSVADYMSNPRVAEMRFAIRTPQVARMLREIIADLK